MTERKISNDWKRITSHLLFNEIPDLAGIIALMEVAEKQTPYLIKHPCQFEVGEKPIYTIQGFSAIFKEEQGPFQIGEIGRSQELTKTGEVAAKQRS